jgi:hypothetical protein
MNNKMVGNKPLYVALAQRKEDRKARLQVMNCILFTGECNLPDCYVPFLNIISCYVYCIWSPSFQLNLMRCKHLHNLMATFISHETNVKKLFFMEPFFAHMIPKLFISVVFVL